MTFREKLHTAVGASGLGLCFGLDPEPSRLPEKFSRDLVGIGDFLHQVIEVSASFASAYKVNTAFYEAWGSAGWGLLEKICAALPPDSLRIADAKRGDIGNTAEKYRKAFFECLNFDAVTVNPYLGGDALQPFLQDPRRGAYVLALTTNPGAKDLQYFSDGKERLYQRVLRQIKDWAPQDNLGAVVGATHPVELVEIRRQHPSLPLLIPGVGAQGGDLQAIVNLDFGADYGPILVNVSRGILFPANQREFPDNVLAACQEYKTSLRALRHGNC